MRLHYYDRSEPAYPARLLKADLNKILKKISLHDEACIDEEQGIICNQLAYFWHYLGDATHHSVPVLTPFGFYPGQIIKIENQFNVSPLDVSIKDIRLTRVNEDKWFWLVEFGSL